MNARVHKLGQEHPGGLSVISAVGATQLVVGASDETLVAAVRRGDDRAFGELYSRYGGRIIAYVLGMVGDHGRAEDIAQEVFISALRRMRATERPIAFKPWIYEIAKNACIDEFRRTRRTKEVSLDSDDEREGQTQQLISCGPTPDTALERRQQLDDLRGAFRGLSDNHHKVLVMRELEGLSYTEIGRRMGMTRPVVESTLFRARRRLGQEYEEIASGRRCEQVHAVVDAGGPTAVRALGVREHRRLARHVAHCQPCRRYAWAAGIDDAVLKPPSVAARVAALLPIPAFLRFRRNGGDADAASASGSHSIASMQTASQAVTQLAGPGSPVAGFGRVAAAVAAVAVAGGGVVAGINSQQSSKPSHSSFRPPAVSAIRASEPSVPHRTARASNTRAKTAAVSKPSRTSSSSSTGATSSGGSSGSTASGQPGAQQSASPAASAGSTASAATSAATKSGSTGSHLPSIPSLPKPQLPTLPKVDLGSVSSDVNNLTHTTTSTVNSAVGTVTKALNGG
jgi:RNA polymerase sigma factor (sigma-70 family)